MNIKSPNKRSQKQEAVVAALSGRPITRRRHAGFELLEGRHLLAYVPQLIRAISPASADFLGTFHSNQQFVVAGNIVYFIASDVTNGKELWKSDGTSDGTVMVKDINPGSASSKLSYLTNVNGTLFFSADDGVHGRELWKSDGTTAGTALVKDILPGRGASYPNGLVEFNGTLFFFANDGVTGGGLWKSDGTSDGTLLVKDVHFQHAQNHERQRHTLLWCQ